jgi:phage terminase small subunit
MGAKLSNGLTLKQDAFCREIVVNGGNATQAYRASYDSQTTDNATGVAASRLLDNPKITLRVEQLQDQAAEFAGISPESIAAEFAENRRLAKRLGQTSSMNTATERKADLKDLFGKRKLDIRQLTVSAEVDMTVEELRELVAGLEAKALGDGKE